MLSQDWSHALEHWSLCIQVFDDGTHPGWHAARALVLLRLGRLDEATQALETLVRDHPGFPAAHAELASLAFRQKKWELAASRWQSCLHDFPHDIPAWWLSQYADCLIRSDRIDEAQQLLQRLMHHYPDHRPSHALMARLAQRSGDWELAASQWRDCVQGVDGGDHPEWQSAYAHALLKLGRLHQAGQVLQRLLRDHPRFPAAHAEMAALAFKRQEWALAAGRWESCIRDFPHDVPAWWLSQYGNCLMRMERIDDARKVYQRLVREYPDHASGHLGLATVAQQEADWPMAASCWERCIRRFDDGSKSGWHIHHASALIGMEKYPEAIAILERIENTAACDAACLANLAKAHYLSQHMEACLQFACRLAKEHPEQPGGYHWCEQALIKLGRFREAADYYLARPDNNTNPPPNPTLPPNYPRALVLPHILGNGNDYSFIDDKVREFETGPDIPHLPVSLVIPVYNRAQLLARTLAAVAHQSYPRDLIEVVVADDGSNDDIVAVLEKYRSLLNLRYVRQEDQGFRLSAVRNLGIRAATHQHLIFLDCDVIPTVSLIEAYMKYFHVTDRVVLMGMRTFVCSQDYSDDDLLKHPHLLERLPQVAHSDSASCLITTDGRSIDRREPILARTRDLKDELFPCKFLVGCNMALSRSTFEAAGYYDEEFREWGGEDIEFACRVYNCGYYFIPIADARGLHQEPLAERGDHQADRDRGRENTRPLMLQKYPLDPDRRHDNGDIYSVPKVSIYIPAYNMAEFIREAVDSVLAQTYTDLEVLICNDGSTDKTLEILETHYLDNPRVRWISQPHTGIAAATNKAVSACRGMYIGQLDADDTLEPTAVAAMVKLLDHNNIGLAYSDLVHTNRHGGIEKTHHSVDFSREHLMTSMICSAFRMFRRRDWSRTAGCDESLTNAVDYDLALKFSEICSIGYLPEVTYRYRAHEANTSLVNRDIQENNHVIAINKALERMDLSYAWRAMEGPAGSRRQVRFERLHRRAGVGSHETVPAPPAVDKRIPIDASVLLAGSGRSGTAWLQELINYDLSHRILFEPFHPEKIDLLKDWNHSQYLRPNNQSNTYYGPAHTILSGDIRHEWIDARSRVLTPHRRIIKDIRTQLLLKWIQHHFPEVPIVMLLRHPCAVAHSRSVLNWDARLDGYLGQDELMADYLQPFRKVIEGAHTPFEQHITAWCIENLVPLKQFSAGEMLVVFYEHLCLRPEREIRRIFTYLGRAYSPQVLAAARRPSALSRNHSSILNGADPVEYWRESINEEQINAAWEICRLFGMQSLYGKGNLPLLDGRQALELFPN